MILFKCVCTEKEYSSLQTTLSHDECCIIRLPSDKYCYGIIDDKLHGNFMDVLSGETLEQVEYLDEEEVRDIFAGRNDYEVAGNSDLLKSIL